ncbi:MAG: hypothetical protein HLUCCA12_08160 [Rhodobacteraceae bacterium HLUCCA12]|nr:MAG: hypothetical protein HLUCCA12_08160 [Rhodobacteraceae bacterium HLUCCA12]
MPLSLKNRAANGHGDLPAGSGVVIGAGLGALMWLGILALFT